MKFEKERKVIMYEFDLELSDKEIDKLVAYGKKNIVNDKQALVNWACNKLLLDFIKSKEHNESKRADKKVKTRKPRK